MNKTTLVVLAFLASALPALAAETPAPAPAPAAVDPKAVPAPAQPVPPPVVPPAKAPGNAEEMKALEQQMQEAKQKIDAAAPAQNTTVQKDVEEISATPVSDSTAQPSGAAAVAVAKTDDKKDDKPFSATVILEHALGSSSFIADPYVGGDGYFAQSWDLRAGYTFPLMGHKLKAWVRLPLEIEFTMPDDTQGNRRVKPSDLSVYLTDAEVYKEPVTDIAFDVSLRYFFPTSYESLNATSRWGALNVYLGASRSFGPIDLKYTFTFGKNFNSNYFSTRPVVHPRLGDPLTSADGEPVDMPSGAPNVSFQVQNTVELSYNVTEQLTIGYSVLTWHSFDYSTVSEPDQYTSVNADVGMQKRPDMLWPTLEVGYDLTDTLAQVASLPIKLSVALGITALHPAQTPDNDGFIVPVIFNAWGNNRAANNYGSVYLDIVGTY